MLTMNIMVLVFSVMVSITISTDFNTLTNTAFYSLYTDGTQQLFASTPISLPQFAEIVGSASRTYCLSAKFYSLVSNPELQCLLSTGYQSTSNAFNIVKYSAHLGVMGYADDFYPTSGSVTYDFQEWNHFCVTFDGSDITIYVNGEVDNIQANPSLSTAVTASQTNYVGQSNHLPSNPQPFYGLITNIRLFSTVLTQTDIQLLASYDKPQSMYILASSNVCYASHSRTCSGGVQMFNAPMDGVISGIKLVHESGSVACAVSIPTPTNWGCDAGDYIAMILVKVTDETNYDGSVYYPVHGETNDIYYWNDLSDRTEADGCLTNDASIPEHYSVSDFTPFSSELILMNPSYTVSTTDKFVLGYGESYSGCASIDNPTSTSYASVYFLYDIDNECENATTFIWEELLEDGIGKPNVVANMDIDEYTLTLKVDIELDYLGYTAADDNGYVYGTTYVIDFEDFNAHSDNIREPGKCENRAQSDILSNAEWDDLWSYSTTPNEADHVGGTSFLAYPSGGEWSVGMASDDTCGTIQYTTELTWNELTSCTNYDGTLGQYIDVHDDGVNITLSGTLYINVVSPYDYNSPSVPYYRVYQLLSQPFMIVVSKTVYVVDSVGINLLTMDVIAVYKENKENTFALVLLTESAEYLQLSRNGLEEEYVQTFIADSSNTAGLTASDFRTLTTTDNEGCLHNKQYICSQLWQITADNAKCSADEKYTDFSGTYNIQFDALCRSESDLGAELYGYCDDWRTEHLDEITDSTTGKVLLSAKLTWKDEICNPKVFEVQFAAEMQFFTDSGYSSRVYATDTDNYLYAVGESSVYIRIISDYPEDTLTVFDTRLINVWLCTFDPLTPPSLDIDPGKGEGGCFEDNKDDVLFGHIYDKENGDEKEGFELDTTTDLESNVIQFEFVVPSKVVRDTLYVHAQIEVSLIESGSVTRRRLLNTKKANQMNHFVYGVGVSSSPNDNNPKPPIHNYNDYYPHQHPQTFVISLQSPWIIGIGALLALLLTANIVFMCYCKYCKDGGSRSHGRYSAVKPEDSEFSQDSELDAINVASDPSL